MDFIWSSVCQIRLEAGGCMMMTEGEKRDISTSGMGDGEEIEPMYGTFVISTVSE